MLKKIIDKSSVIVNKYLLYAVKPHNDQMRQINCETALLFVYKIIF
jgi:hypothetical protein